MNISAAVLEQRPKAPEGIGMQASGDYAPGMENLPEPVLVKCSGCKQKQEVIEAGMQWGVSGRRCCRAIRP